MSSPSKTGPSKGNGSIFQPSKAVTYWRLPTAFFPMAICWKSARTSRTGKRFWSISAILIAGIMIPMILISFAGGAFLAFRSLRPIRNLIYTTQSIIDTGRMDARVPIRKTGDELDELSGLFNRMLERIEGLIKGMREALDNVAHDLRTPMTRLRSIAETSPTVRPGSGALRGGTGRLS